MTALQAEEADNLRLRRAAEALAHYREAENQARRNLAEATEAKARAKEKYEALFIECETRAGERRKAGLIPNNPGYGN